MESAAPASDPATNTFALPLNTAFLIITERRRALCILSEWRSASIIEKSSCLFLVKTRSREDITNAICSRNNSNNTAIIAQFTLKVHVGKISKYEANIATKPQHTVPRNANNFGSVELDFEIVFKRYCSTSETNALVPRRAHVLARIRRFVIAIQQCFEQMQQLQLISCVANSFSVCLLKILSIRGHLVNLPLDYSDCCGFTSNWYYCLSP